MGAAYDIDFYAFRLPDAYAWYIIGEYLWRKPDEAKWRQLYVVENIYE